MALYVHWPFCVSKCPYCDFNSHAADPAAIDQARWRDALVRELETVAGPMAGRRLTSIFFGGGTPSLMAPETAHTVIEAARNMFATDADLEITLEANPSSSEAEKFRAFRDAGVTRLSIGVQALDDAALAYLGRAHDAQTARATIAAAAKTFARFSFDLIYARPGQTVAAWQAELADALQYGPKHLSLYQLTIEPGTAFFRDRVPGAPEGLGADLYEATQKMMAAAGLPAYEISNHAAPGHAARHNVAIWQGADYLGVGPGAHGRLRGPDAQGRLRGPNANAQIVAHHRKADPARWLAAVEAGGHGTAKETPLGMKERAEEMVLLGLRLTDGIDTALFHARSGLALDDVLNAEKKAWLIEDGFLSETDARLAVTPAGALNLNAVLAQLLS